MSETVSPSNNKTAYTCILQDAAPGLVTMEPTHARSCARRSTHHCHHGNASSSTCLCNIWHALLTVRAFPVWWDCAGSLFREKNFRWKWYAHLHSCSIPQYVRFKRLTIRSDSSVSMYGRLSHDWAVPTAVVPDHVRRLTSYTPKRSDPI